MTNRLISMTEKESAIYGIIKNLIDGKINGTDASKQVGISIRQIKRLKAKVIKLGPKGLIHGNRGHTSNRKLNPKIIEEVKKYLKEKYYDFKPIFDSEKLAENHNFLNLILGLPCFVRNDVYLPL